MHRFLVDRCEPGANVVLSPAESRHALKSLRLGPGDAVAVFDGAGRECEARIVRVQSAKVLLQIGEPRASAKAREFAIATAVPKGSRLDWMIEKLAELGACEILPVRFQRSVASIAGAKRERLERLAVAAAKQSGRASLPRLASEITFEELVGRVDRGARVAAPGAERTLAASGPASLVVIGPEGGLTPPEEAALVAAGAERVSLGPTVLRIETAAIAAAAALAQL